VVLRTGQGARNLGRLSERHSGRIVGAFAVYQTLAQERHA
jgi:adenine/guanine phosphoribosyltransferase-like PRPP-binding protein